MFFDKPAIAAMEKRERAAFIISSPPSVIIDLVSADI
jgi:hypothetical protein